MRIAAVYRPAIGPSPAYCKDLKRRGLLDSTLVAWAGEFGRSPDNGIRRGSTTWGATDEIGQNAVAKLTYLHAGRFRQLSQFGGQGSLQNCPGFLAPLPNC